MIFENAPEFPAPGQVTTWIGLIPGFRFKALCRYFPAVKKYDLNFSTTAFLSLLLLFFGAFLFYPASFMLKGAFFAGGKFTLRYFSLLLESPLQRQSIFNSFAIALLTTGLTTVLALPLAHWMTRFDFRGKGSIRLLMLAPIVLPGMVIALFLSRVFFFLGLAGTFSGLVLGHTLLGLPYMARLLSTSFEAIPPEVSDAASNLGASELRKMREVYLPLAAAGIFAGVIFTFVASLEEFALTYVIGTPNFQTIPTILFSFLGQRFVRPVGAAVSLILLVPNVVLLFIADRAVKEDVMTRGYGKL